MTFEQGRDMLLGQFVVNAHVMVCAEGQRDYLDAGDVAAIAAAAGVTSERVVEACHRAGIKVVP